MSVHPPEMEVQTCGEDCKDCELETVGGRTFGVLLARIRSRMWRCLLMQHVAVGVLRRETSAARSGKAFGRSTHLEEQRCQDVRYRDHFKTEIDYR
jgi:hypothetical protein